MAEKAPTPLPLKCEIVEAKVDVGSGKKGTNKIVIRITNTAATPITFSGMGAKGELALIISTGNGPDNLVTLDDSTALKIEQSPKLWDPNPLKTLQGQVTWSFKLSKPVLEANAGVQLTLANFESNVDPGRAKITISAKISGYAAYQTVLEVEKKAEQFALIYFTADPPYLITEEDKNKFKLTWNVVKAGRAVLSGYNDTKLQEFQAGSRGCKSGQPFVYDQERPWAPTTRYKLEITDEADETKRLAREVTVPLLTSGWYPVTFPYGYPAVLCSMNNVKLYGIFVKAGKASLYSSEYPYAKWMLENEEVPEGMLTSPAVCLQNKLWLIGGGAADPNLRSNEIWSYDSDAGEWRQHDQPLWSPRMGHACVVFNDKLWVLGGNDETGTSVNEVWAATFSNEQFTWEQKSGDAPGIPPTPWPSRCMFAVTTFNRKLWIYGGLTEPFSDPLEDLWSSEDGKTWQPYTTIPKYKDMSVGKPLGATLQVVNNTLNLFGSFGSGTITTSLRCILSEGQQRWNTREVEGAWDDQEGNSFSLVSVQHKGLIFLRSLDYRTRDNPTTLRMYIP